MNATPRVPVLLALFLALYAWNLGTEELSDVDEGRSGTIVKDMAEGGHWLLPRTPDGAPSEKPIVYYGTCALAAKVVGLNEWALRGVSALAAVGTLALTGWLTRLYGTPRAAAIAVAALGSNVLFMTWARMAYVDMTLTFFLTAALTAYFAARAGRLRFWPATLLGGAALGLATLTKGPMGLALPLAVVGCDVLVETRGRFWRAPRLCLAAGPAFALALGIALAWYLPAYARGGDPFLETSVLSENFFMPIGRARGLGVSHHKSWHFYPTWQVLAFLPVLPLLPEAARWALRRDAGPARARLATWFLVGFALFMAASNKRRYYLLPLQPALAAMIGLAADHWLETGALTPWRRGAAIAMGAAGALASLAGIAIGLDPTLLPAVAGALPVSALRDAAWDRALPALIGARGALVALSTLGIGAAAYLLVSARRRPLDVARAALIMGLFVVAFRSEVYTSFTASSNHTRPFVEAMRAKVPPGARPVIASFIHGYALEFYWPGGLGWDAREAGGASWLLLPCSKLPTYADSVDVIGVLNVGEPDKDVALVRRK